MPDSIRYLIHLIAKKMDSAELVANAEKQKYKVTFAPLSLYVCSILNIENS